jgi:hypothetical protein
MNKGARMAKARKLFEEGKVKMTQGGNYSPFGNSSISNRITQVEQFVRKIDPQCAVCLKSVNSINVRRSGTDMNVRLEVRCHGQMSYLSIESRELQKLEQGDLYHHLRICASVAFEDEVHIAELPTLTPVQERELEMCIWEKTLSGEGKEPADKISAANRDKQYEKSLREEYGVSIPPGMTIATFAEHYKRIKDIREKHKFHTQTAVAETNEYEIRASNWMSLSVPGRFSGANYSLLSMDECEKFDAKHFDATVTVTKEELDE